MPQPVATARLIALFLVGAATIAACTTDGDALFSDDGLDGAITVGANASSGNGGAAGTAGTTDSRFKTLIRCNSIIG